MTIVPVICRVCHSIHGVKSGGVVKCSICETRIPARDVKGGSDE